MNALLAKIRLYWPLIKSLQTGLLVATGLAGYMSARCPVFNLPTMTGLLVNRVTSISGSTILNMWWDRDIDARMRRTRKRPLASGAIAPTEALWVGLALSALACCCWRSAWSSALRNRSTLAYSSMHQSIC